MANIARITQDAVEFVTSQNGNARITQDAIEFIVGVGISCDNPPNGQKGFPYSHTFPSGGGTPPYTFSLTGGSLPPGLSLNTSTGVVSGTPTVKGLSTFTITVIDIMGTTQSVTCSILILDLGTAPVATGGGPYVIPKPCVCDIQELAFEEIQRFRALKGNWPYRWSFPPPGAIRVTAQNSLAVPTVAAGETEGFVYTVDQGFEFALESLTVEFLSSGRIGAVNPGDFTWTLDKNRPVGFGDFQGMTVQGFTNVDVPLGSVVLPWPLACADVFSPNDVLRTKFINVALLPGSPNFFKTILRGWRWPVG